MINPQGRPYSHLFICHSRSSTNTSTLCPTLLYMSFSVFHEHLHSLPHPSLHVILGLPRTPPLSAPPFSTCHSRSSTNTSTLCPTLLYMSFSVFHEHLHSLPHPSLHVILGLPRTPPLSAPPFSTCHSRSSTNTSTLCPTLLYMSFSVFHEHLHSLPHPSLHVILGLPRTPPLSAPPFSTCHSRSSTNTSTLCPTLLYMSFSVFHEHLHSLPHPSLLLCTYVLILSHTPVPRSAFRSTDPLDGEGG